MLPVFIFFAFGIVLIISVPKFKKMNFDKKTKKECLNAIETALNNRGEIRANRLSSVKLTKEIFSKLCKLDTKKIIMNNNKKTSSSMKNHVEIDPYGNENLKVSNSRNNIDDTSSDPLYWSSDDWS